MADIDLARKCIPFDSLSDKAFARVAETLNVDRVVAGDLVCTVGDAGLEVIYLLSGTVEIKTEYSEWQILEAGSDAAQKPMVEQSPRPATITAVSDVLILPVDRQSLDWELMLDEVTTTINEIQGEEDNPLADGSDWLEGLKTSETFSKLPAEKIAALIMKLEEVKVKYGDVVVRQNDPGDYYYIIKSGSLTVSRREGPGEVEILAELVKGNVFGEESLISGTKRNASIFASADSVLMRLSKADFDDLLKDSMIGYVTLSEASTLFKDGAKVLDVRPAEQAGIGGIHGAKNIPVTLLRERLDELNNTHHYIIYCQTGNQSEVAAFLLSQRGFEVSVLKGGLQAAGTVN